MWMIVSSIEVTPSDTEDLTIPSNALLVGTAGDVKITYQNGATDTVYLAAGEWHPMSVKRVWSTGTGAADIRAGYTG